MKNSTNLEHQVVKLNALLDSIYFKLASDPGVGEETLLDIQKMIEDVHHGNA